MPPDPPIHAWYVGHTGGLQPFLSPSNILSHREVPFQRIPPPMGKSLKKALTSIPKNLLNVCLHIKFILLTTPHVVHTCDNVIGHKLNYIYQFIMKSTAIRWRKKLFAEGSRRKKIVCNDNNTKQNCLR